MTKPHQNDISVGQDQWITFVNVEGRQSTAVDIDPLLTPMNDFLDRLETTCVAGCCGIDAFDLWPEHIQRAAAESGDTALPRKLLELKAFIDENPADCFVSTRLNNYFDRGVLLQVLDHIATHLKNAASS